MTYLRWIGLIGGLLLALSSGSAVAQSSADAYFHDAAQRYVAGDLEAARRAVDRGLEVSPSDPRLRALRKKIRQQEKTRRGGRSSPRGPSSSQPRSPSRGQPGAQQQSGEAGERPRPPESPNEEQTGRRSAEQARQDGTDASERGGDRSRGQRQGLSRAQAVRLLRALKHQEMKLLQALRGTGTQSADVEKDW